MKSEQAQAVALQALAFLASQDDPFAAFLAQSGIGAGELRARAQEPEVLAAVMDFVLSNDDFVYGLCDMAGLRPEDVLVARAALPGGDVPIWT